jgi:hypothetical protein
VRLWDFSGFDAVSTEPVPTLVKRKVDMLWFWEPAHFKRAVGERILAAIYDGVAGYGAQLTPGIISAHLAAETAARDEWLATDSGKWRERLAHAHRGEDR